MLAVSYYCLGHPSEMFALDMSGSLRKTKSVDSKPGHSNVTEGFNGKSRASSERV